MHLIYILYNITINSFSLKKTYSDFQYLTMLRVNDDFGKMIFLNSAISSMSANDDWRKTLLGLIKCRNKEK